MPATWPPAPGFLACHNHIPDNRADVYSTLQTETAMTALPYKDYRPEIVIECTAIQHSLATVRTFFFNLLQRIAQWTNLFQKAHLITYKLEYHLIGSPLKPFYACCQNKKNKAQQHFAVAPEQYLFFS
jgi:hypothetical protein